AGGNGDDNLYGGENGDTFVFLNDVLEGADRIKDWEDGLDVLDLSDFGFASFADVLALASNSGSTNMKIEFSPGHSVVIENFRLTDFD
ncbi:MAG: calcium-binding protein, partial [Pseudomonadota bacterium]